MRIDAEDCEECGCPESEMEWDKEEGVYHCPNCGAVQ